MLSEERIEVSLGGPTNFLFGAQKKGEENLRPFNFNACGTILLHTK